VELLAAASTGFLYAVTVLGITGAAIGDDVPAYLRRVRSLARVPVCAGFGIRTAADVARLGASADGVIVGTALVEAIGRGEDPGAFLNGLRA
jgi:tryptophan synthase alpha chain